MTGKDTTPHNIYQKRILFRLNAKTNSYLSQLNACKRENNEHQRILAYLSCLLALVILLASAVGHCKAEEPPQYILHVLVLGAPQLHYNDILPDCMKSYRILYDEDEGTMYKWLPEKEEWLYLSSDKKNKGDAPCVPLYAGEAAFYLTYGERFYDVASTWFHRRNPWFKKQDDEFYERLEGMEP